MTEKDTKGAGFNTRRVSLNGGIGPLVRQGIWAWGWSGRKRLGFLLKAGLRFWGANRRRKRAERKTGFTIPTVLVVSVTMACNYSCQGCYSRGRPDTDELSEAELDALFSEAEAMGLLAVVLTGGEPLLKQGLLDLIKRHRKLLFILITNGSLVAAKASFMKGLSNLLVLVSLEGSPAATDERRGSGAHAVALMAMNCLKKAGVFFGFAATNTAANSGYLASDYFIGEMIERGSTVGLITEYVPCGPRPRQDWLLDETMRKEFRERIKTIRSTRPIVLVQFPHDEYGEKNLCTGAGRVSLHINAQGGVEPCPFVPVSRDNIRRGGLNTAFSSPFLKVIRECPRLLSRRNLACSLFENMAEVENLAKSFEETVKADMKTAD